MSNSNQNLTLSRAAHDFLLKKNHILLNEIFLPFNSQVKWHIGGVTFNNLPNYFKNRVIEECAEFGAAKIEGDLIVVG